MRQRVLHLLLPAIMMTVISCSATRDPAPFRFSNPLLNRFVDAEPLYRRYTHEVTAERVEPKKLIRRARLARRRLLRKGKVLERSWMEEGAISAGLRNYFRLGKNVEQRRGRLLKTARALLGSRKIHVKGRRFRADCTGFVQAVFYGNGINLYGYPGIKGKRGGVRAIVKLARKLKAIHFHPFPKRGDLVFFHNTYDYTRDGQNNDWYSHVGIVEKVDKDGTVTFIDRYGRSIKRNNLNLLRPHSWRAGRSRKRFNSYMRARKRKDPSGMKYLAGELFAGFATLIR